MSQIPQEKIEEVRLASDIVDVVSGYLTLRQKGRNHFGLCPFHSEKTPSFSVNSELQIFHCFGCGAGGNVFTFIMKMEGLTFPEAVKLLAKQASIALPEDTENLAEYREKEALYFANELAAQLFQQTIRTEQAVTARRYLSERGIADEEFDDFGIGYAPNSWDGLIKHAKTKAFNIDVLHRAGLVIQKDDGGFYDRFRGRITFAIKNLTGQVVGFGARRIIEDNSPKYINSPETDIYQKRFILYGLHQSRDAIRKSDEVIVVEGYTDLTSLYRVNVRNVVATSGTALTQDHARLLHRYTSNAILLYDADSAGAAAAIRGADILLESGLEVKICVMPTGLDPDEYARSRGEEEVRKLLLSAVPLMEFKLNKFEYENRYGSSSQKASETRSILASIAKVNDPIRRSFLVRDLSERLKIDEASLWKEISQFERQNQLRIDRYEKEPERDDKFFRTSKGNAELGLLQVSLRHPDLIERILKNLSLDDISHHEIRLLFQEFSKGIDLLTFQPQAFLTAIQDQTIAAQLSNMMVQDDPHPKPWEFARDCLIRFHLALIDHDIQRIREKMKPSSTSDGDINTLMDELKYDLDERKKIQSGQYIVE
ncbi:DNA primase [candidate division KSB1 bacterium]|nr:DNA primase [candidate division KSB1 bacterium]RQW08965.1 MAG: DNA primase [candidate division KSB1 bacterium]